MTTRDPTTPRIAIFGASINPPCLHHRRMVARLAELFDEVVVIPCGPRPDKLSVNDTRLLDRAVMADLSFRGLARVSVELFDLEADVFTRAHRLEQRYRSRGEVWHVVSGEIIRGGGRGESQIQVHWERGEQMWRELDFALVLYPDEQPDPADLPPRCEVIVADHEGAAADVRRRVFEHQSIDGLVTPAVASYIQRHRLFRGVPPSAHTEFRPSRPRFSIIHDERNPRSRALAEQLAPFAVDEDPELIVVLGGDGTMLHTIRQRWRERVPFYGINTGHVGFLLNQHEGGELPAFWEQELRLYQLPLLLAEVETLDGERRSMLAFNDAWVERATGQTAWVSLTVNGDEVLPKVVADGVLVSTAAGSTSYARAMGATPVPFHTPVLLVMGSNVLAPNGWRPAMLGLDTHVRVTTLDPDKRPLLGYIDGVAQGRVRSLDVRASRIAAAELVFDRQYDPVAKLLRYQFPARP